MSVASLKNGQLQLSELIISNEKFSNANGYLAASSSFSSSVSGTNLSVGTSITAPQITVGAFPGNNVVLTCDAANTLQLGAGSIDCGGITSTGPVSGTIFTTTAAGTSTFDEVNIVGTCNATAFGVTNGANAISLQCLSNEILTVGGSIVAEETLTVGTSSLAGTVNFQLASSDPSNYVNMNVSSTNPNYLNISEGITTGTVIANSFSGGIGANIVNVTIPELTSGAYSVLPNQTITGFVGSSSSVYIATPIGGSVAGFNPYSFIAGFASTSGGNTTIYLSVSNLSGGTIPSIPIQVALLGVN